MKAGVILLLGAAVVVLYFVFQSPQAGGPLGSQPSILQRLFPGAYGASGANPSPLTNRGLTPSNYLLPQTSQTPIGVATAVGAGAGAFAALFAKLFTGNPASTPSTAQQASGSGGVADQTAPLSNATGGLLQGPTASGTPLSVSAGWQPTDSAIASVGLTPPGDPTLGTGLNLQPTPAVPLTGATVYNIDPLTGNVVSVDTSAALGTLPLTAPPDITAIYPGYDSTVPVDTGIVSLPDATTPDTVIV